MRPVARTLTLLAALLAAGAPALPAPAGDAPRAFADDPRLADLPDRWRSLLDLFDAPGMAVAVVDGDRTFVATLGTRDAAAASPVTPDTLFYVASITKTYTAALVLSLAEEGRLDLDRPLVERLPRFALADPAVAAATTPRHLLSHRPGLVAPEISLLDAFTGEITDDRYYGRLPDARIEGALDGAPRYSNLHFTLLGRLVEQVEGAGWRDALRRRVLDPAGLTRTTTWASELYADPDVAWPLERVRDGAGEGARWRLAEPLKTDRTMHAAGGLATTAREAARWMRLLLDRGVADDGAGGARRVLRAGTVDAMLSVQAPLPEPDGSIRVVEGIGHAWQVGNFNGRRLAMHGGTYAGTSAFVALLPDGRSGVAVLIHAGGAARGLGDIASIDVLERLTGTKAAWDVHAAYTERARATRAEREATATATASNAEAGGAGAATTFRPSRPPGVYAGVFGHPDWGHLIVERDGDALALRLGELPLALAPLPPEGGTDRVVLAELFDEPATLRFAVERDGTVERVVLEHPARGPIEFRR